MRLRWMGAILAIGVLLATVGAAAAPRQAAAATKS